MKRVLVTGAAGFVGRHLVPMLSKNKFDVVALVKTEDEAKTMAGANAIIVANLSQEGIWQNQIKPIDFVIHLAAEISSKTYEPFYKNNVVATRNLLKAIKGRGIKKIILFSSAAVTSIRQDWYSKTKKEQERIIIESKISYAIIRPSMIYGPGDKKNIDWLINLISKLPILPLPGGGSFGRQPIFVTDICKVVLALLVDDKKKKVYEIHGKEYVTLSEMVRVILKASGKRKIIFSVPLVLLSIYFGIIEKITPNPKFTGDQIKSLILGEKFKGDKWWDTFDIMPTPFEAGVSEMLKVK